MQAIFCNTVQHMVASHNRIICAVSAKNWSLRKEAGRYKTWGVFCNQKFSTGMITQLKYCFKWQYMYRFNIFSFLAYTVCFVLSLVLHLWEKKLHHDSLTTFLITVFNFCCKCLRILSTVSVSQQSLMIHGRLNTAAKS